MSDGHEQYVEKLLGAVNDAAGALSRRFAAFLSVVAYVAITVASTTDEMLVRGASLVKLPLLNTDIPLTGLFGFYTVAPWLVVLMHSDLLLQLSALSTKIRRLDFEVARTPESEASLVRERMVSFYYVQYLTPQKGSRAFHWLSGSITWLTVVVVPLGVLLAILVRFLPFHRWDETLLHQAAVVADALLVLWLWRRIAAGDQAQPHSRGSVAYLRQLASLGSVNVLVCLTAAAASVLVASFPGDGREKGLWVARRNMDLQEKVLTQSELTSDDIHALTDGERWQQTLRKIRALDNLQGVDLRHANLFNAVLPKLDLRARRAKGPAGLERPAAEIRRCEQLSRCEDPPECVDSAIVGVADLSHANLQWAKLEGISLDDALLEHADLGAARVQGGSLQRARLNGARLAAARLEGANLSGAKLCDVDGVGADMSGATLSRAQLQGAEMAEAVLTKAGLVEANLRSASLCNVNAAQANMERVDLSGAQLQGAYLSGAVLTGARLLGANLGAATGCARATSGGTRGGAPADATAPPDGVAAATWPGISGSTSRSDAMCGGSASHLPPPSVDGAFFPLGIPGADLAGAQMAGADLTGAILACANLPDAALTSAILTGVNAVAANLQGATLVGAVLEGADLSNARLTGADLSGANLKGASLRGADLSHAVLEGADCTDADLSGASTDGVVWGSARGDTDNAADDRDCAKWRLP